MHATRGHLPRRALGHVAELANEHHGVPIDKRQDSDAVAAAHDPVGRGLPVRQLHDVLSQRQRAVAVNRRRRQPFPWRLRELRHYFASTQVSDPFSLAATFEKKIRSGWPSAVPRCSVEMRSGPAFL